MKRLLFGAFALLLAAPAFADEPPTETITWRTGALVTKEQTFLLLGVGVQLQSTDTWTLEATADVALSNGLSLPTEDNGFLGVLPIALTGLYHPLPDLRLSPFLEVGGGVNLASYTAPDPFLHGGGGASYQNGDWSVSTDVRFLFLPTDTLSNPIDERGVQMTLALQRGF